ncbi:9049_t:CDS:2, partial [Gigaspora margarita]
MNIPRGASEVLLLCYLKNKGAKSVFIPKNRNGNPKEFAIISFGSQKDQEKAQSRPIRYFNHIVLWQDFRNREAREMKADQKQREFRNKKINKKEQEMDYEYSYVKEEETKKKKERRSDESIQSQLKGKSLEDLLWKIFNKMDRLEKLPVYREREEYKGKLDAALDSRIKNQGAEFIMEKKREDIDKIDLNEWWNIISESILEAARKCSLKRKVTNTINNKKRKGKEAQLGRTLTQLGSWIKKGKEMINQGLWEEDIIKLNKDINKINEQYDGPEELLTKIRISQGLQLIGATGNDWHQNMSSTYINLWKNEKKNLYSTKVFEILGKKFTRKTAVALKNLNMRSINQLINKEGKEMISWQQLKMLRKKPIKGRPANWFKELEKIMLANNGSRKLKQEFMISNSNRESLLIVLDKVLNDNRKREWIVTKQPKRKESSNALIGKAVMSTGRKVLTEHWKLEIEDNVNQQTLKKCSGCKMDQFGKLNTCKKWNERNNIQGSISRFIKKKQEFTLLLNSDMIVGLSKEDSSKVRASESVAETLTLEEVDMVLIGKQQLSQTIKDELTRRYRKNCSENRKVLTFYTNGSLKKAAKNDLLKEDSMGA